MKALVCLLGVALVAGCGGGGSPRADADASHIGDGHADATTDVAATDAPMDVAATDASADVAATDADADVAATDAQADVAATDAHVDVAATDADADVAATDAHADVAATDAQADVAATDAPMDVAATDADAEADAETARDAPVEALPPPASGWRSGTRLRARLLAAVQGDAVSFDEIVDTKLGTTCRFGDPGDGQARCLPYAYDLAATRFQDSACAIPLFAVPKGTTPPSYVFKSRLGTSCNMLGLFVLRGATTPGASGFTFNGVCKSTSSPPQANSDYYLYDAVSLDELVGGHVDDQARGPGLAMRSWASDDGGYFPLGALDVTHATTCKPATVGPLTGRCVPADLPVLVDSVASYAGQIFFDAQCQNFAYLGSPSNPSSPCLGIRSLTTTWVTHCGLDANTYAPVEPTGVFSVTRATISSLYTYSGAGSHQTCVAFQPTPAPVIVTRGAALDPTTLPVLTTAPADGTARLRNLRYASSTGDLLQTTGLLTASVVTFARLHDSTLQESCHPELVSAAGAAEVYRCMPDTVRVDMALYSDAACTKLSYRMPKGQSCIATAARYLVIDNYAAGQFLKAGAVIANPTLYEKYFDGTCHPSTLSVLGDYDWYETTTADLSSFPEVRFVVE